MKLKLAVCADIKPRSHWRLELNSTEQTPEQQWPMQFCQSANDVEAIHDEVISYDAFGRETFISLGL